MEMITTNPLFLLTKISQNNRIFIVVSILAGYGLFLYELLPEYLFIPTSALIYFVLPSGGLAVVLVILPKLLSKGTQAGQQASTGLSDQALQTQSETISLEQTKDHGMILPDANSSAMMQGVIQGQTPAPNEGSTPAVIQAPGIDEIAIQDMVSRSIDPIQKDNTRMQDTISDLRNEVNSIKGSMDSLAATVESSLTDLKSFQAELANPLNFMRKYFDTMDIKSLSDPSLPLNIGQMPLQDPVQNLDGEDKIESITGRGGMPENGVKTNRNREDPTDQAVKTHEVEDVLSNGPQEVLAFKQMLGGKLTLGKLMTTISLMEQILQTLGRDSIDVLIDQCKLMGLNQEDEHIVYNVVNMMDKSGLSVNDTLIMLYKFGKVMGMNDKESDLIYAKLMMNQIKNHDSDVITVEKKAS